MRLSLLWQRQRAAAVQWLPGILRDVLRFRTFIAGSVRRDIEAQFRGSLLGGAWVLIQPLAMISVYTLVFANVMRNRLAGVESMVEVVETIGGQIMKRPVAKWELVTMHTARHTFATQSLLRGMPVEVLQKVLGHSKIQTTMIYAKVVEDLQHQTMRRIWEGGAADPAAGSEIQAKEICAVVPEVSSQSGAAPGQDQAAA